jgi:hypothetical protein
MPWARRARRWASLILRGQLA